MVCGYVFVILVRYKNRKYVKMLEATNTDSVLHISLLRREYMHQKERETF